MNRPPCSPNRAKQRGALLTCSWWALTGSNRRPSRCKRDALPTELSARHAATATATGGGQAPAAHRPTTLSEWRGDALRVRREIPRRRGDRAPEQGHGEAAKQSAADQERDADGVDGREECHLILEGGLDRLG